MVSIEFGMQLPCISPRYSERKFIFPSFTPSEKKTFFRKILKKNIHTNRKSHWIKNGRHKPKILQYKIFENIIFWKKPPFSMEKIFNYSWSYNFGRRPMRFGWAAGNIFVFLKKGGFSFYLGFFWYADKPIFV